MKAIRMLLVAVMAGAVPAARGAEPSPANVEGASPASGEGAPSTGPEGEPPLPQTLAEETLPLRTALHHNPALVTPLKRLVTLYRERDSVANLILIYQSHCLQYPGDSNAAIVLLRILTETQHAGTGALAVELRRRFPDDSRALYAVYLAMRQAQSRGAVGVLRDAIAAQTDPQVRDTWLQELLPQLSAVGRVADARGLLARQEELSTTAESCLPLVALYLKYGLAEEALALCHRATAMAPSPETGVELALRASAAEAALGRRDQAGQRLDALLDRLTEDYWRREEIMARRVALVATEAERDAMIRARRALMEAHPGEAAPVRDLARLLAGFDRRREALDLLTEALRRQPDLAVLVNDALALFDRLNDQRGKEAFLAGILAAHPERSDLELLRIKTLFFLARREDASKAYDALAAVQAEDARLPLHLETARFLRRSMMPTDAARLFRLALEAAPGRADIRRELAETLVLLGDTPAARELFAADTLHDAAPETLNDAIQFMLRHKMVPEARGVLEARLPLEPVNLELRIQLAEIHRRLQAYDAGRETLAGARAISDTTARYAQWLEAAVAFHVDFGQLPAFVAEEGEALRSGHAAAENTARAIAFARAVAKEQARDEACALLRHLIGISGEASARIALRRQLVAILQEVKPIPPELDGEMARLAEEDPDSREEVALRRMLLAMTARQDYSALAEGLGIELERIGDPSLLSQLLAAIPQYGGEEDISGLRERLLMRLTAIDPTNLTHWNAWLSLMARTGDEERLRLALRRLLTGIEGVAFSDETRLVLRSHLAASLWRSIATALVSPDDAVLRETLTLLDDALHLAADSAEWRWITFARAVALHRLGRVAERDAARGELSRVSAEDPNTERLPGSARIAMPDGPYTTADALETLFAAPVASLPDNAPPPPIPVALRWRFDAAPGAAIQACEPVGEGALLVTDRAGGVVCLDALTGKIRWREGGDAPGSLPSPSSPGSGMVRQVVSQPGVPQVASAGGMPVLAHGGGRVFLANGNTVVARDVRTGKILWEVTPDGTAPTDTVRLLADDTSCFVFIPSQSALVRIAGGTGKRIWKTAISDKPCPPEFLAFAGWDTDGTRLLVYASGAAILDRETGRTLWTFDETEIPVFPLDIKAVDKEDKPGDRASAPVASMMPQGRYSLVPMVRAPSMYQVPEMIINHQQRQTLAAENALPIWDRQQLAMLRHNPYAMFAFHRQGGLFRRFPNASFRLAGSVTAWAAERGPRLGAIRGNRMVLWSTGQILSLAADLPVAARIIPVQGHFLDMVDRYAFLRDGPRLVRADLDTGDVVVMTFVDLSAGICDNPLGFMTDGYRLYFFGAKGMVCVNARDHTALYARAWPAGVLAAVPPMDGAAGQPGMGRIPRDDSGMLPIVLAGTCILGVEAAGTPPHAAGGEGTYVVAPGGDGTPVDDSGDGFEDGDDEGDVALPFAIPFGFQGGGCVW